MTITLQPWTVLGCGPPFLDVKNRSWVIHYPFFTLPDIPISYCMHTITVHHKYTYPHFREGDHRMLSHTLFLSSISPKLNDPKLKLHLGHTENLPSSKPRNPQTVFPLPATHIPYLWSRGRPKVSWKQLGGFPSSSANGALLKPLRLFSPVIDGCASAISWLPWTGGRVFFSCLSLINPQEQKYHQFLIKRFLGYVSKLGDS